MAGYFVMQYVFPLMLGRTFDMNTMRVGVDIFPKELIESRTVYEFPEASSFYGPIDGKRKRRQFSGVPFPSYVSSGILDVGGPGDYFSDNINIKTLDMVSRLTWKSSIEYLPDSKAQPEPIPNWQDYGEALGTHYVYQIYYGAETTASMRFEAKTKGDMEMIRPAINHKVFKLGSQVEDEYLKNALKSVESTQIKLFSNIPLSKIPNNMESLNETFKDDFARELKPFSKGRGLPQMVVLRPLSDLDSSRNRSIERRMFEYKLESYFFDNFEDLRDTKVLISNWMKNIEKPLTEQQELKVADLHNSVENMLKIFYETLDALGTPQGPEKFENAIKMYRNYGKSLRVIFKTKFHRLRKEIEKDYKFGNSMPVSK